MKLEKRGRNLTREEGNRISRENQGWQEKKRGRKRDCKEGADERERLWKVRGHGIRHEGE